MDYPLKDSAEEAYLLKLKRQILVDFELHTACARGWISSCARAAA